MFEQLTPEEKDRLEEIKRQQATADIDKAPHDELNNEPRADAPIIRLLKGALNANGDFSPLQSYLSMPTDVITGMLPGLTFSQASEKVTDMVTNAAPQAMDSFVGGFRKILGFNDDDQPSPGDIPTKVTTRTRET